MKQSLSTIATTMGRAKSTLSRELKRNQISGVKHFVKELKERQETLYLPDTAQVMAARRREEAKSPFESVSASCLEEIKARLALHHGPEQIAGRLKREDKETVSHETIYQMIYAEYEGLGKYKITCSSQVGSYVYCWNKSYRPQDPTYLLGEASRRAASPASVVQ